MKTIPSASVDTQALIKALEVAQVGQTIEYDALSKVIGRDVRKVRGLLYTAFRNLMREKDIVFAPVRGVGVKRLAPEEIVELGIFGVRHIRRTARRTIRKISCAQLSTLSEPKKVELFTHSSLLGAVSVMSSGQSIKKLAAAIQTEALPLAKTLALFQ